MIPGPGEGGRPVRSTRGQAKEPPPPPPARATRGAAAAAAAAASPPPDPSPEGRRRNASRDKSPGPRGTAAEEPAAPPSGSGARSQSRAATPAPALTPTPAHTPPPPPPAAEDAAARAPPAPACAGTPPPPAALPPAPKQPVPAPAAAAAAAPTQPAPAAAAAAAAKPVPKVVPGVGGFTQNILAHTLSKPAVAPVLPRPLAPPPAPAPAPVAPPRIALPVPATAPPRPKAVPAKAAPAGPAAAPTAPAPPRPNKELDGLGIDLDGEAKALLREHAAGVSASVAGKKAGAGDEPWAMATTTVLGTRLRYHRAAPPPAPDAAPLLNPVLALHGVKVVSKEAARALTLAVEKRMRDLLESVKRQAEWRTGRGAFAGLGGLGPEWKVEGARVKRQLINLNEQREAARRVAQEAEEKERIEKAQRDLEAIGSKKRKADEGTLTEDEAARKQKMNNLREAQQSQHAAAAQKSTLQHALGAAGAGIAPDARWAAQAAAQAVQRTSAPVAATSTLASGKPAAAPLPSRVLQAGPAAGAAEAPAGGAGVRLRDVVAALHADFRHPPSARLLAVAEERLRRLEQGGRGQGALPADDQLLLRPLEPTLFGFTPAAAPRPAAPAGATVHAGPLPPGPA